MAENPSNSFICIITNNIRSEDNLAKVRADDLSCSSYQTGYACALIHVWLCNPMDYSPPGSSVHGTFQARTLEWLAISSSRGFSQARGQTCVSRISCTAGVSFTTAPPGKPLKYQIRTKSNQVSWRNGWFLLWNLWEKFRTFVISASN